MTVALLTALVEEVDEPLRALPHHPEAHRWPSEVVTGGLWQALTGVGNRPFSRWLPRADRPFLPRLPERTRLLRLLPPPQDWPRAFLAPPTGRGVMDPSGIERIPPRREGRRPPQSGRPGVSHHRGMVGGNLCLLLHHWGLLVGWACATAPGAAPTLPWLLRQGEDQRLVLRDTACHAAAGDPANLKLCPRGEWEDRMLVETVRAMLTRVCHLQKVMPRGWASVQVRLACTRAAFKGLVQWHGFPPNASGCVPLSIADFGVSKTKSVAWFVRN